MEGLEELTRADALEAPRHWQVLKGVLREVIETVILSLAIFFLITTFLFQNFRVVGASMEPTLHSGEYIIVDKLAYRLHPPQRGDIVVFSFPQDESRDFIKRVVGVPEDEVRFAQGQLYINGQTVEEPYLGSNSPASWGPRVVEESGYFVLGDNRNNSHDSRNWGFLPQANIIGKAWIRYWPPRSWGLVSNVSLAAGK